MNRPIVLLTDYGQRDPYVGVLKGVIASRAPRAPIFDLTHGVEPQNIVQASAYLQMSVRYFPKGSIFVCVVDPGVGTSREILCARSKSYYFLAPDNGLLTGISEEERFEDIRAVVNTKFFLRSKPSATFHGRDIFAPAAALLNQSSRPEKTMTSFGPKRSSFMRFPDRSVQLSQKTVIGSIVYFDHFGNAVTDIRKNHMAEGLWRAAKVFAGRRALGALSETYGHKKRLCAFFNSADRLEIALPGGSAKNYLEVGEKIKVTRER